MLVRYGPFTVRTLYLGLSASMLLMCAMNIFSVQNADWEFVKRGHVRTFAVLTEDAVNASFLKDWNAQTMSSSQRDSHARHLTVEAGSHYTNAHEFVRVGNTSLYVISAFWDERLSPVIVHFLGLAKTSEERTEYWCRFYNTSGHFRYKSPAILDIFPEVQPEFGFLDYRVVFGHCNTSGYASHISVCTNSSTHSSGDSDPSVLIPLKYIRHKASPPNQLGLCLKPLYDYTEKDLGKLLEYFEFQQMVGVQKVYLYDIYNCDSIIYKALHMYIQQGFVELVPWQIPMRSQNTPTESVGGRRADENKNDNIKCFGQVAALMDCIYSNMDIYEFLMIIDYDEFIIPRMNNGRFYPIQETLHHIDPDQKAAGYIYTSVQCCDSLRYDNLTELDRVTTNHKHYITDEFVWKSIVVPRKVYRVNAHQILKALLGIKNAAVAPIYGLKLHYRVGRACPQNMTLTTTIADPFQQELRTRINLAKQRVKQ